MKRLDLKCNPPEAELSMGQHEGSMMQAAGFVVGDRVSIVLTSVLDNLVALDNACTRRGAAEARIRISVKGRRK